MHPTVGAGDEPPVLKGVRLSTPEERAIVYTSGDGVAHRSDCDEDARREGAWAEGTIVRVTHRGVGPCLGWSLATDGEVSSWVRDRYVAVPSDPGGGSGSRTPATLNLRPAGGSGDDQVVRSWPRGAGFVLTQRHEGDGFDCAEPYISEPLVAGPTWACMGVQLDESDAEIWASGVRFVLYIDDEILWSVSTNFEVGYGGTVYWLGPQVIGDGGDTMPGRAKVSVGEHVLRMRIDPDDAIPETRESDNFIERTAIRERP